VADQRAHYRMLKDVSVAEARWSGAVQQLPEAAWTRSGPVAAYFLLAAATTIGDPGDIGGALILLMGCTVMAGSRLLVGKDLHAHWSHRRRT
jgi:hypothetical protein